MDDREGQIALLKEIVRRSDEIIDNDKTIIGIQKRIIRMQDDRIKALKEKRGGE